jgi:hypothetical protein
LLDGKTYASYKARYEDNIVKQMIKMMREGDLNVIYPEKLGIWNTLLSVVKQMLLGFLTTGRN